MIIAKKRINSVDFLDEIECKKINIGIKITNKEYEKLGLDEFQEGMSLEPSPEFGINCNKNTNGFSYTDKKQEKIYRYITTRQWHLLDWGGYEHTGYSDVYRYAYPKVEVNPTNIEFVLVKDKMNREYILADIGDIDDKRVLKQTINMFLEIFCFCEIFNEELELVKHNNQVKRCNWEILPKDIKIDLQLSKKCKKTKGNKKSFEQYRFDTLNTYNPFDIFCGIGGFTGYYAFIFDNICCLESSYYGNATYIIPKKNWQELSKLSKKNLMFSNHIINKINHNENWKDNIVSIMEKLENK